MSAEAKANPGRLICGIPYVGRPIHLGDIIRSETAASGKIIRSRRLSAP